MADQKLIELKAATPLTGSELVYGVQAGVDVKINTSALGALAGTTGAKSLSLTDIRITGDSVISQNDTSSKLTGTATSSAITKYPKFMTTVGKLTGNAFNNFTLLDPADQRRYGYNSGVGGRTMPDLIAALPSILATMTEKNLFVHIGTNSVNSGDSFATMRGYALTIIGLIQAAGVNPIMSTILPRNSVDGALEWSNTNGGTTIAQKRVVFNAYNDWLVFYCKDMGIRCVNWHGTLSDSTGQMITGYSVDGLHPNGRGSYYLAMEFISQLNILPGGRTGERNAYDVYDATNNPMGNILNGSLTGTAGVTSDAGGTGTITGTVPTGFQLAKVAATTTSVSSAIVPRSDGQPGNVVELTFTSAGTGSATEEWRLNYWNGSNTSLIGYGITDDLMLMEAEIEYVAGTLGVMRGAGCHIRNNSATTKVGTTISFDAATKQIRDSANGFGSFIGNRAVNVFGAANAANNAVFKVISATAGVLQLDSTATIVNEAAGNSVTVALPNYSSATMVSVENAPNVTTPILYDQTPVFLMPLTGNMSPRLIIFINGTIAGTTKVRFARPKLYKLPYRPAVTNIVADDS